MRSTLPREGSALRPLPEVVDSLAGARSLDAGAQPAASRSLVRAAGRIRWHVPNPMPSRVSRPPSTRACSTRSLPLGPFRNSGGMSGGPRSPTNPPIRPVPARARGLPVRGPRSPLTPARLPRLHGSHGTPPPLRLEVWCRVQKHPACSVPGTAEQVDPSGTPRVGGAEHRGGAPHRDASETCPAASRVRAGSTLGAWQSWGWDRYGRRSG